MQVEGQFVLHITDGCVCVCGCNYTSSLLKSVCIVVLNVPVGMLIGDRSQLPAVQAKASWVVVMYTMNNHTT